MEQYPQGYQKPKRSFLKIFGIIILLIVIFVVAYGVWANYAVKKAVTDPEFISQFEKEALAGRDEYRLEQIRNYQTVLNDYYQKNKRYPDALMQSDFWYSYQPPQADTPCTEQQNAYQYKSTGTSYTLGFCLGTSNTEGLSAGLHTATPSGIK